MRLDSLRDVGVGIIIGLLLAAVACIWIEYRPSARLATSSAKLDGIPVETKSCTTVQMLAAPAKKKLGLPKSIQKDEQAGVLAAIDVPGSQTAVAVLHRDTGVGEIYLTPQPWLAFNRRWTFGGFYGVNDRESGVMLGTAEYEFLQLKRLHGAIHMQADTSSRWFIGAGFTF